MRWYLRKGSCLGSNTVATNSVFRCGWPIGFDALIPWRDQSPGQVVYLFRKRACPRRKHFNFTEHLSGGQQVAAAVSMSSVAGCFITFHPIYCTCPTCPAPTFSCITHTRDHIAGTPPSPLPTANYRVHAFIFIFLSREEFSFFFPRRLASNCANTRYVPVVLMSAFGGRFLHKIKSSLEGPELTKWVFFSW